MRNNPTCHLKTSHLWGFEITHIVASFSVMMLSNFAFSSMGLPVFGSWILGIAMLLCLRILSIGKKAGHLGFVMSFLLKPRFFLGVQVRPQKGIN